MHHDDPADMSIDDRLKELATLVAVGFLRRSIAPAAFPRPHTRARRVRKPRQIPLGGLRNPRLSVPHVDVMCRSW